MTITVRKITSSFPNPSIQRDTRRPLTLAKKTTTSAAPIAKYSGEPMPVSKLNVEAVPERTKDESHAVDFHFCPICHRANNIARAPAIAM